MKIPTLAIVGHGRAGKDEAGLWLKQHTKLRFAGGCSWAARHFMAEHLSQKYGRIVTPEEAYTNRHGFPGEDASTTRILWYDKCNEYRKEDPAKLVRLVLETSDFVCGIRDKTELVASKKEGLLDLIIWVERPGIPEDPTLTFTSHDCDIVILNDFTLEAYLEKWRRLASALRILE